MVAQVQSHSAAGNPIGGGQQPAEKNGTADDRQQITQRSPKSSCSPPLPSPQQCAEPSTSHGQQAQKQQNELIGAGLLLEQENPQPKAEENCSELLACSACESPIQDQFLFKVLDQSYHERCLCCSICSEQFPKRSCFIRERQLFCREHFLSTFGPKCSRCSAPIGERAIVRRANQHIYHLECFQCVVCKRELNTGDQFYLIPMDGRLVCRQDFENSQKGEGSEMDCGNKRPRTTISAKSLETLKQAYQCSSKPARHIREQLAAQTGLDMRVVQVWFQNRRAKEKRLKKDANRRVAVHQQHSNSNGADGTGGTAEQMQQQQMGSVGLFRAGTLDSDSGASNNDAESPIYSIYTNPSEGELDVHSSTNEFYADPNSFLSSAAEQMAAGLPPSSLQQLSVMMPPMSTLQQDQQQQQMSPLQRTPPAAQQSAQSMFASLDQLNGGGIAGDPRTPTANNGTPIGMGGQQQSAVASPGTPHSVCALFSPPASAAPGHQQMTLSNGISVEQQQQYLLAATTGGGFCAPPLQLPHPSASFAHSLAEGIPPPMAFYPHHPPPPLPGPFSAGIHSLPPPPHSAAMMAAHQFAPIQLLHSYHPHHHHHQQQGQPIIPH